MGSDAGAVPSAPAAAAAAAPRGERRPRGAAGWGRSIPSDCPGTTPRPHRRHVPSPGLLRKAQTTQPSAALSASSSCAYRNPSTFKEMAPPYETKMDSFQGQPGLGATLAFGGLCQSDRSAPSLVPAAIPPLDCAQPDRGSRWFRSCVLGDAHLSFKLPETKTECGARIFLIWSAEEMWFICHILRNGREKPQEDVNVADGDKNSY